MNLFVFLNKLENTLNDIDVKGKENISKLMGCFLAIEELRQAILSTKDGEKEDGGQVNTGTDTSSDSTDK